MQCLERVVWQADERHGNGPANTVRPEIVFLSGGPVIESIAMRLGIAVSLLVPCLLSAAPRGKLDDGLERLLYVTDRSGISVYDINDGHKLLRKIDVPGTGDYKGISISPQLGKLY